MGKTYVFEDVDIGNGWRACIAVAHDTVYGFMAQRFMAYNEARDEVVTESDEFTPASQGVYKWTERNIGRIEELHAEHIRQVRSRRALCNAVEKSPEFEAVSASRVHDGGIMGQTMELIRRHVDESHPLRNGDIGVRGVDTFSWSEHDQRR